MGNASWSERVRQKQTNKQTKRLFCSVSQVFTTMCWSLPIKYFKVGCHCTDVTTASVGHIHNFF